MAHSLKLIFHLQELEFGNISGSISKDQTFYCTIYWCTKDQAVI